MGAQIAPDADPRYTWRPTSLGWWEGILKGESSGGSGTSNESTATGVNPTETHYSLYGHTIPLSVFGVGRIGGEIIAGPWIENGLASFCISFGFPADPAGTRTLREIAFDSEVVWDSVNGFSTEEFTYRFYEGTLTQSADALETSHFGADAVAYRPQILIWFENLPLANTKFKKIPYVAAVIADGTGDDVNLGEAFERLAASPWVDFADFETSGITDGLPNGGLIIAQDVEFLGLIQQFGRFYGSWDILQTDKLRIVDRGDTVTPDISLDKSSLKGQVVLARAEPNSVPRKLVLSTIDADADYTIVPSEAAFPLAPVNVSSSVRTESAFLPAIMDAATRMAVVTFTKYQEEHTRKKITGVAMAKGLEIEPGALMGISGLGDDFPGGEVFKVMETLHGADYSVEFTAESIIQCEPGAITTPPTPDPGDPPLDGLTTTGAWSASRKLYSSFGRPSFYTLGTSGVDVLFDQSGNGRDLNNSSGGGISQPTISGIGMVFDGVNDYLTSSAAFNNFITATDGYMIVTCKPTGFPTNSATKENNSVIIQSTTQNAGMVTRANGGSPIYYAGSDPNYLSASIAADTVYVMEWRHEGGVLYQRTNGTGETSMAAGNTHVDGNLNLGGRFLTAVSFQGEIYEAVVFSTVPDLATRDALVQRLGLYAGASV